MHIIEDDKKGTITLCPTNAEEKRAVIFIAKTVKVGQKLTYNGRGNSPDGSTMVYLHVGGKKKEVIKKRRGDVKVIKDKMFGGHRFVLRGTSPEDKNSVAGIRDMCYFATTGLIYLGKAGINGSIAVVFTGGYCKLCKSPMIDIGRCEWKVCEACAAKCDHNYISGFVHGGPAGALATGSYCDKCGRGKPLMEGETLHKVRLPAIL